MTHLNQGFEYQGLLGADAAGVLVIDYLARCYPGFTREDWLQRIESGRVLPDGIPSVKNAILRAGQQLSWVWPPGEEPEVPLCFAVHTAATIFTNLALGNKSPQTAKADD